MIELLKKEETDKRLQQLKYRARRKKKELRRHRRSRIKAYFFLMAIILCAVRISVECNLYIRKIVEEKQEKGYAKLDLDFWNQFRELMEKIQNGMEAPSVALNEKNREELNQYIGSLKRRSVQTVELKEQDGVAYYQYVQKNDIGEYTIADAGTEIIFPGAIIRGDSLFQGTADYTLLAARRTPMYLTNTQIKDASVLVNNVNYRTVSSVLYDYEAKAKLSTPQNWKYNLKTITSEHDVKLSFGVSVADLGLDLGASQSNQHSTVAVVYKQVYYSVNAEPLQNAVDYFENGFDPADLGEYEPAYVSSVDYGRMFVVFVSGDMSVSELNAKLGVCLNGVSIGAGISNIITNEELEIAIFQQGGKMGNANKLFEGKQGKLGVIGHVKEFIYGSDGEESVVQRVNDFLEMDGDLLNPEPLSYQLKYLSDNEVIPAIAIEREGVIPAGSAKTVTLSLKGDLYLNFSDDAGMILPQKEPSEIMLLWNSCFSGLITGTLDNKPVSLDLYSYKCGVKSLQNLWKGGSFLQENKVDIHILDSVSEMP